MVTRTPRARASKEKQLAEEALICSGKKTSESLARYFKKNYGRWNPGIDFMSEAYLGLVEAAIEFDPSREAGFPTFASCWIKTKLRDLVRANRAQKRWLDVPSQVRESLDDERPNGLLDVDSLDGFPMNAACQGYRSIVVSQYITKLQNENPTRAEIAERILRGETLSEIAKRMDLTTARISQISKQLVQAA